MVLGFMGFAQLVTIGQVIDLKLIQNREILFGGPNQNVLQLVTPEKKYVFGLTNLMVMFTLIPVNYTQVRSGQNL